MNKLGHELRRPEADFLRNGIFELRTKLGHVNYRVMYFFDGTTAAVVTHGIVKENFVPAREIELALWRMNQYLANRELHTQEFP